MSDNPALTIHYEVSFSDSGGRKHVVEFSEVGGISDEIETEVYYEANNLATPIHIPKQRNVDKISFKRGTDSNLYLVQWYQLIKKIVRYGRRDPHIDRFMEQTNQDTIRRDVNIKMFPYFAPPKGGVYQRIIRIKRAWPVKMMWQPLNALQTRVHIEEVVMSAEDVDTELKVISDPEVLRNVQIGGN